MIFEDKEKNVYIEARELVLGENLKYGRDIDIKVRGKFQIGSNSVIGDRFKANAEEIIIGDYFFNVPTDSRGMAIGGGASGFPNARLKIGDRMVCHTGHINLACPVTIGNDVGLSHDVDIITHGFWASVLEGYPRSFEGVTIGNNVIVGWKTVIMSGVNIVDNIVIGAQSTITKSLTTSRGIYVGSPAKLIKMIEEPTIEEKYRMFIEIEKEFRNLMSYYEIDNFIFELDFPLIKVNNLVIDTEKITYTGMHDHISDAFRDFLRRYGIRLFAPHGFLFNLKRK